MSAHQTCRGCGCTEDNACVTPAGPCHWVEPGLCSACAAMSDHAPAGPVNPKDLLALKTVPPLRVQIGGVEALFLMSALQLVLRHHEFPDGPVRETTEDFARVLQEHISVTPSLAMICEAGWHAQYDVPPEKPSGLILPGDPGFAL